MTDASGTVVWSADYKPFGEAIVTVSTITNNLRFPGQYFDQETGLHYNYFRDYNPVIGKYIEGDPVGIDKGQNHLYVYVVNNPANWTDADGLVPNSLEYYTPPYSPPQAPRNCSLTGMRQEYVNMGQRTVVTQDLRGRCFYAYFPLDKGTGATTAEYVYLNSQPLAKIEGTNAYYYHNDHLGTPQKMTDSTGAVVWSADYKPFGEATITISTITNNLRFPGQYFDSETGLHYNYYRDYNPALDRYIEWDPIGLKGNDLNLYAYVRNPLRFIDPWGLELQVTVQEGTGTGTYGATVTVVNTNTNTTVFTGQGSSLPNNSNTQNTVANGTYAGTNTTRASGGPGIFIGETPTAPGSPRTTATNIFVHCGSTQTNRGSAGCLTVRPDQCQEFFRNFTPEQPVTVNVRR